jgi:hypothetical protein
MVEMARLTPDQPQTLAIIAIRSDVWRPTRRAALAGARGVDRRAPLGAALPMREQTWRNLDSHAGHPPSTVEDID